MATAAMAGPHPPSVDAPSGSAFPAPRDASPSHPRDGGAPPPARQPDRPPPRLPRGSRRALHYALAVALPLVIAIGIHQLGHGVAAGAIALYFLATVAVAWVGGTGPGLVATALAIVLGAYSLEPYDSFRVDAPADRVRLLLVGLMGVAASVFVRRLADARRRAERAVGELHTRVSELQRQSALSQARAERLQRTTGEYELITRALSGARDAADAERARIARLLGSIKDGFFTLDAEHRVTYANDATLGMWRLDRAQVTGRVVWDLFPDAVGSPFHANTLRSLRERVVTEYESYYAPLGTHFAVKTVPFEDGVSVVLRDVSARVAAEADLRSSEARYRALVQASSQLVWATTADGQIEDMPRWRELTGQSVEEVRGSGWLDALHPDDRARAADTWRRALASRTTYECDYRLRLRDGSSRWYHARGVPVTGDDGAVREWVGILMDVDAERRAEEGRALLERASEALVSSLDVRDTLHAVVRLAVDGTSSLADSARIDLPTPAGGFECVAHESRQPEVAAAYRALEARFPVPVDSPVGFPKVIRTGESELIGAFEQDLGPVMDAIAPEHAARLRDAGMYSGLCVPLRARGETLGALTLVLHGPERRRPFDRRDLAVAEELGRRAGLAYDNAVRYQVSEAARAEAEGANRAKADFLAVMSHELRTPLNAIAGYAELLLLELRGTLTAEQREDILRIQRSQHHLLALVNDVLNFAKLDAGRVEFDIEAVPVSRVLDGLDALVAPQMAQKQLAYELAECDARIAVRADAEKLRQVLLNLLSNAVKATDPGGRIGVRCVAEGDVVRIAVEDTGHGIPADKSEKIFQPFVQLDRRLTSGHEGTGLGLAISRELARAMGGDLTVESEVGVGSRFTVTLPKA